MALLGIRNGASSYISAGVRDTKAKVAYQGAQPMDKTNQAKEVSAVPGGDQVAAKIFPDESDSEDKVKLFDNSKTTAANKFELTTSKPTDSSPELTKRLVAAVGQFEVRQVMSEVNKNLMSLRMIAAAGKGQDAALARAYIKKLEKLLTRASRKIEDLDEEDALKLQQVRAEQLKQKQRVEEIKTELRKKQNERRTRENGYLLENLQDKMFGKNNADNNQATNQNASSEAAITAQAEAIASAETTAGSSGGSADGGVSPEVSVASSAGADSGADIASVEGGGESAV